MYSILDGVLSFKLFCFKYNKEGNNVNKKITTESVLLYNDKFTTKMISTNFFSNFASYKCVINSLPQFKNEVQISLYFVTCVRFVWTCCQKKTSHIMYVVDRIHSRLWFLFVCCFQVSKYSISEPASHPSNSESQSLYTSFGWWTSTASHARHDALTLRDDQPTAVPGATSRQ